MHRSRLQGTAWSTAWPVVCTSWSGPDPGVGRANTHPFLRRTTMPPAGSNARTFSLQTPADLYRKMRFEAAALRQAPPEDLTERAYAVMNAVTTAWQMKDWAYETLRQADQLDILNQVA